MPSADVSESSDTRAREFSFSQREFERVRDRIRRRAGIVLADSKQDMVYSRLARRIRALGLTGFAEYLDMLDTLKESDGELEAFTNALTTNLTSFFREPHHFEVLRDFLGQCRSRPVKIWCAAASTGEEPYSLAMTAVEALGGFNAPVKILATDIDTQVLATAQAGIYPLERVEKMETARLQKFFRKGAGPMAGQCRVVDGLRDMISFQQLNLLDSQYPMRGPFDVVFCRNVMIYFDKPTQLQILQRVVPLMSPDGLFFAGHSETYFQAAHLIQPIGKTVYRIVEGQARKGVAA